MTRHRQARFQDGSRLRLYLAHDDLIHARSARLMFLAALILLVSLPSITLAEFIGKVVGVIDGDSIRVMHRGKAEPIRLLGIDCPEKRQPFGTRAKEYTSELVFGQDVTVYGDKRDRYGRRLAEVLLPDGRSLNQETHQGRLGVVVSQVFEGPAAGRVGTSGAGGETRVMG